MYESQESAWLFEFPKQSVLVGSLGETMSMGSGGNFGAGLPGFKSQLHVLASATIHQGLCLFFCKLEIDLHRVEFDELSPATSSQGACTQQVLIHLPEGADSRVVFQTGKAGRSEDSSLPAHSPTHRLLFLIVALFFTNHSY